MPAVVVASNGAVVVPTTGASVAAPPTSADPDSSHFARPVEASSTEAAPAAQVTNQVPPAVNAVVVPSQSPAEPVVATSSAVAPVDPPAPAPTSSITPVEPPAQPTVVAVPPADPPAESSAAPAVIPAETSSANPTPAQDSPPDPSAQSPAAPSDPPPEPAPVAQPSSQASAINGANVFAPEFEVQADQTEAPPASETPPPPVTGSTSDAVVPATSPSPSDSIVSGSAQASSASIGTTISHTSASNPVSASTQRVSGSSLSDQAERTGDQSTALAASETGDAKATGDAVGSTEVKNEVAAPTEEVPSPVEETTFVSGSITFTGTAALAAASAAETEGERQSKDKDGLSSFAIIGIVGGILVFFILAYIAWYQWRKRRARKDLERIDDLDDGFSPTSTAFDPYNLGNEKHSGFDFIDQPLSSWRSQKSRYKSPGPGTTLNPFTDNHAERGSPGRNGGGHKDEVNDEDYQRRLETEYTETWYSDPGEAGLRTANAMSPHRSRSWFGPETAAMTEGGDRRPSYIDGPQSIYHETNDPTNPNAHTWTEVSPSARSPQSAKSTMSNRGPAPPVPPLPAAYQGQSQTQRQSQSRSLHQTLKDDARARPETDFSCGDFYQGYDHSRPNTEYTQFTHDNPPETSFTTMETPATSTLLPWLSKKDAPPPIPVKGPVNPTTLPTYQPQRKETGGFGFGSPPKMPLRGLPAAAMAQKPNVQSKGWLGVIPTFR